MSTCLIPHGRTPVFHALWLTPIADDPHKKLTPNLVQTRKGAKRGGRKGPATKRAMSVARRLVPLKGDV